MDFVQYRELVERIPSGKWLPQAVYIHESALPLVPPELLDFLTEVIASELLGSKPYNLIKFFRRDYRLSLLWYPTFFDEPYPALDTSLTIDLLRRTVREASYKDSENPPILHRKETFLAIGHPARSAFAEQTRQAEALGLLDRSQGIGFRRQWEMLIRKSGYRLTDEGFVPLSEPESTKDKNAEPVGEQPVVVQRHLTALSRYTLSVPMQSLARHGYLNGRFSVFDYGCGKGDDVRELKAHGLDASGWDPVFAPDSPITTADVVNLGYVVNVIESRTERQHFKMPFSFPSAFSRSRR